MRHFVFLFLPLLFLLLIEQQCVHRFIIELTFQMRVKIRMKKECMYAKCALCRWEQTQMLFQCSACEWEKKWSLKYSVHWVWANKYIYAAGKEKQKIIESHARKKWFSVNAQYKFNGCERYARTLFFWYVTLSFFLFLYAPWNFNLLCEFEFITTCMNFVHLFGKCLFAFDLNAQKTETAHCFFTFLFIECSQCWAYWDFARNCETETFSQNKSPFSKYRVRVVIHTQFQFTVIKNHSPFFSLIRDCWKFDF